MSSPTGADRMNAKERACEWVEDEDANWYTGCKETFCLNDGTPADNGMKFCCYCGGTLTETRYTEPTA